MPTPALSQLSRLKQKRYIVSVMTLLMIGAVVWVSSSLLGSYRRTKIPPETQAMAKPLTPSLELSVLENIEQRRKFSQEDLANFPIYKLIVDQSNNTERIVPIDYQPSPSPSASPPSPTPTSSLLPSIAPSPTIMISPSIAPTPPIDIVTVTPTSVTDLPTATPQPNP